MVSFVNLDSNGHIATITLNRPDRMNAINAEMVKDLTKHATTIRNDESIRVVVLRGAGEHFSSGGDMEDISAMVSPDPATRSATVGNAIRTLSRPLALEFAAIEQPIVSSVRGHAIGVALQLVIMSDLVVASQTARFTLPQIKLGHTPDHGESWALPRKIGIGRSLQMTLMGGRISAMDAERFGLVNWVVDDSDLETRSEEIARQISCAPPQAMRKAKALLHSGLNRSLEEALACEETTMESIAATADFEEAIRAFGEKRKPNFSGS